MRVVQVPCAHRFSLVVATSCPSLMGSLMSAGGVRSSGIYFARTKPSMRVRAISKRTLMMMRLEAMYMPAKIRRSTYRMWTAQ